MTTATTNPAATIAAGSTTNTGTILSNFVATLEADEQKAVAWVENAEQKMAQYLTAFAQGLQLALADAQAAASAVLSKLSLIQAAESTITAAIQTVAPNNATAQKLSADIQAGVNDAAALAQGVVSSTAPAGSSTVVTDTVTAINAAGTLAGLAGTLSATLSQLATQSPTATQTTSAPTPNEG